MPVCFPIKRISVANVVELQTWSTESLIAQQTLINMDLQQRVLPTRMRQEIQEMPRCSIIILLNNEL